MILFLYDDFRARTDQMAEKGTAESRASRLATLFLISDLGDACNRSCFGKNIDALVYM